MFRPENRRFLLLVVGIISVALTTLILMEILITKGYPTQTTFLTGFAGLIVVQFIALLRQEQANQVADEARQTIDHKLNTAATAATDAKVAATHVKEKVDRISQQSGDSLVRAVDKVAKNVRAAERDQVLKEFDFPQTREDFRKLLEEMSDSLCGSRITKAADESAKRTVEELKVAGFLNGKENQ